MKSSTKLTIKEAVALFVWRNPNCRGYEIQAAYFYNRFGRMPVTRQEKSLNGTMTSTAGGGGLCVNARKDACNGTRHEDRILIKDFHGHDRWPRPAGKYVPPTFTLSELGLKYVQRALAKLADK